MSFSEEEEVGATKQEIAVWKDQAKKLKSTKQSAYILTLVEWDHSGNWGRGPDENIIGIFDSKAAAVARSVTVDTCYGEWDEAIKDMFPDGHEDNRNNPPDNGTLIQLGGADIGEGDYVRLVITKKDIFSLPQVSNEKQKNATEKRTATSASQSKSSNKKQKKR